MCGIAGVFGRQDRETVQLMLRAIAHRGPDDLDLVSDVSFTLGTCRLAVVGEADGKQPTSDSHERVWVGHNGEIYNFRDLQRSLALKGNWSGPPPTCDTQVLADLYLAHGVDFVERLDGMFGMALFDRAREEGLLVRDRVGQKPLYYWNHYGSLWFASELKALREIPDFPARLDREALHHYLSYKNVPAPFTAYEGVRCLPPSTCLNWRAGEIRLRRYWKPDWFPVGSVPDERELAVECVRLLRDSVKKRLSADSPVGLFLSGGLDSSLLLALAAEGPPVPPKVFTLTYDHSSTTARKTAEAATARRLAEAFGAELVEETVSWQSFQAELPKLLQSFDEPFSGVTSTWFLAREAAKHTKAVLGGDGSDELFGSYLSHRIAEPIQNYFLTGKLPSGPDASVARRVAHREPYVWRHRLSVFTEEEKAMLYSPDSMLEARGFSSRRHLAEVFRHCTAQDPLNKVLEAEFSTQLPDQVLTFCDRLSMAHSLELRSPFLDTALVEFAARIPSRYKIAEGVVKKVLKSAARDLLPTDVIEQPKEGFVMPVNDWLSHQMLPFVRGTLAPSELEKHGLFSSTYVEGLLQDLARQVPGVASRVLCLLSFQIWYTHQSARIMPNLREIYY